MRALEAIQSAWMNVKPQAATDTDSFGEAYEMRLDITPGNP